MQWGQCQAEKLCRHGHARLCAVRDVRRKGMAKEKGLAEANPFPYSFFCSLSDWPTSLGLTLV